MNYQKIYDSLIEKAKVRIDLEGVYYERHHILPKSLGGNNSKSNLVKLTAKEHFIAHLLLFKISKGKDKVRMGYALHRMMFTNNSSQAIREKITSRKYQILKSIYLKVSGSNHLNFGKQIWSSDQRAKMSERMSGSNNPSFGKDPWNKGKTSDTNAKVKSIANSLKEYYSNNVSSLFGIPRSESTKKKISISHTGKSKSTAHRENLSISLRGRVLSEETKLKMSISRKGVIPLPIICPFCNKEGKGSSMFRWHFDNCKKKVLL